MTVSLIVVLAGDSNAGNGKYYDPSFDTTDMRVSVYNHDSSVKTPAKEPLDNYGMAPNCVGSTLALCRLLSQRGKIPTGFDNILIVPCGCAGTSLAAGGANPDWCTTGNRYCLDGGGALGRGLYSMVNGALALNSRNRVWFFDWNQGENDGGTHELYQNNMIATWGEIRSTIATAAYAPILVPGEPPNRCNIFNVCNTGTVGAQHNVASYLPGSIYIDTSDLNAPDYSNGFVHLPAVSHRGGINNAPQPDAYDPTRTYTAATSTSSNIVTCSNNFVYRSVADGNIGNNPITDDGTHWQNTTAHVLGTVANPLSERKYNAILQLGWRIRATWS